MKRSEIFPSKWLAQDDLGGHELTVRITGASLENVGTEDKPETKLALFFHGQEKGYLCNPTNFDTIESIHGEDTDDWIGKNITLYVDPTIKFGVKRVGGIRIRPGGPEQAKSATSPTGNKSPQWQLGMWFLRLAQQEPGLSEADQKALAGELLKSQTGYARVKDVPDKVAIEYLARQQPKASRTPGEEDPLA